MALVACGGGDDVPRASGGTAISIVLPTAPPSPTATATAAAPPADVSEYSLSLEFVEFEDEFIFVGDLIGGPDSHPDYYCLETTWDFGDGNGVTTSPDCVEYTPESTIPREFIQQYAYRQPGTYEVTLTYGDLVSNPVTVTVVEGSAGLSSDADLPGEGDPLIGIPELVYPSIVQLDPRTVSAGEDVQVHGQGGFVFTPPSAYDESARDFTMYLDGEEIGTLACYGGSCLSILLVPDIIESGEHTVSVDGGSRATLTIE